MHGCLVITFFSHRKRNNQRKVQNDSATPFTRTLACEIVRGNQHYFLQGYDLGNGDDDGKPSRSDLWHVCM